jgi:hypothetical protein
MDDYFEGIGYYDDDHGVVEYDDDDDGERFVNNTDSSDDDDDAFGSYERSRAVLAEEKAEQEEEKVRKLPDSPFVACSRIREFEWVKKHHPNMYHLRSCVEFELRPDWSVADLAAAAATSGSSAAKTAARQLLGLEKGARKSSQLHFFWISPWIFLARGPGAKTIDTESKDRFTLILRVDTKTGIAGATAAAAPSSMSYSIGCRTRLPSDNRADRCGEVELLVALFAGGFRSWEHIALSTRRALRPLSASTQVLKDIVASSHRRGWPREVQLDYHGLSNEQWKAVFGSFHSATRLAVTDETMDGDNNCFPCLLEALRQGYAPKRIAVRTETQATVTQMEQLTSALRESRTLTELCLLDLSGRERFQSLISIAEASGSLQTLEVEFTPRSPEDWETIWSVAASHPTLSTLRVRYRDRISYLAQRSNSGFDLLQAVETAARSNNRLMLIDVADESQKYHQTKEFKDRILPILRTNRIVNLTNAIKKSTEPDWSGRLFGVAVHRLCKSNNKKKGAAALSCLFSLFRGYPECLERCTRVPDALHRLWFSRMRIVNTLLGEVLEIEHRMVASGVETPSATAPAASLPNVTSWGHAAARGRPSQH